MQGQGRAVQRGVLTIRIHGAGHGLAAFLEALFQVAFHQTGPVAVHLNLVFRVNGGNGVFAILNGGDGGFQQHVFHVGRVVSSDRVAGVELDFRVQVVVLHQHPGGCGGIAQVTLQLEFIFQAGFF